LLGAHIYYSKNLGKLCTCFNDADFDNAITSMKCKKTYLFTIPSMGDCMSHIQKRTNRFAGIILPIGLHTHPRHLTPFYFGTPLNCKSVTQGGLGATGRPLPRICCCPLTLIVAFTIALRTTVTCVFCRQQSRHNFRKTTFLYLE